MNANQKTARWTVPAGVLACLSALAQPASAQEMTAGVVLDRMNSDQLMGYFAGIIEGLAYARYQRDGQTGEGMGCIYDWFYAPETMRDIFNTFDRFPDHSPGAVMAAMVERACGS